MELTEEQKKVLILEEKYFEVMFDLFNSNIFLRDLKSLEQQTLRNYDELVMTWGNANKIDIAFERLIKYHIFRHPMVKKVYTSPISSDVAFYTDDCIICLDAKSINYISNPSDTNCILSQRNQINFQNVPHKDSPYIVRLPDYTNDKYVLTYFLQLNYKENPDINLFNFSDLSLSCVPNNILGNIYNYDILQGFKTYEYVTIDLARDLKLRGFNNLQPRENKSNNWIEKSRNVYLDPNLKNPYYENGTLWRKISKNNYRVLISGSASRISIDKILNKNFNSPYNWNRFERWKL